MDIVVAVFILVAVVLVLGYGMGFVIKLLRGLFGTDRIEMSRRAQRSIAYGKVLNKELDKDAARRNRQHPQAPPAAMSGLSTQLAQLNDALQAGLITQQEYAKKRADVIASA
jgi:hypothetical protein